MKFNDAQSKLADLREQYARCLRTEATVRQSVFELEAKQKTLELELDEAIKAALRTGDESMERDARQRLLAVDAELATLRDKQRLAGDAARETQAELRAADMSFSALLNDAARKFYGAIEREIRADKKLRSLLIEAVALFAVANGGGGQVVWELHLQDVFPPPSDDEYAQAFAAARARLGVK